MAQFIVVLSNGRKQTSLCLQCPHEQFAAEVSRVQRESSNLRFEDGWKIDPTQTICRGAINVQPAIGSFEYALCPF